MFQELDGVPPGRVAVLTHGASVEDLERLETMFPGSRVLSVGSVAVPEDPVGALRAVRDGDWEVVVVAKRERKLTALALAMRSVRRYVLRDDDLEPFGARDLVAREVRRLPGAPRRIAAARTTARTMMRRMRGWPPVGLGNDYSGLAPAVEGLPADWPKLRVSVVVPVYNRREILAKTLAGLLHQTYPKDLFEVVVADDGSHDHPETLVDEFPEIDVRVLRQDDLGFRAARVRNLAIRAATGDVVVLLDCDMLPAPQLLASHLRWFHVTDLPVVTIGMRRFVSTDGISAADVRRDFGVITALPDRLAPAAIRMTDQPTVDWRVPLYERTADLRTSTAPYRLGASGNLGFRREHALAAGLFDEAYERWGGEDTEFSYRLQRRGGLFIAARDAVAFHQEHPDAVVREEDAKVTRRMSRDRIPVGRREEAGETFRVPKVAILARDGDVAPPRVSHEVLDNAVARSTSIDRCRAAYVFEVGRGPVPAGSIERAVRRLDRDANAALITIGAHRAYRVADFYRIAAIEPPGVVDDEGLFDTLAREGTVVS